MPAEMWHIVLYDHITVWYLFNDWVCIRISYYEKVYRFAYVRICLHGMMFAANRIRKIVSFQQFICIWMNEMEREFSCTCTGGGSIDRKRSQCMCNSNGVFEWIVTCYWTHSVTENNTWHTVYTCEKSSRRCWYISLPLSMQHNIKICVNDCGIDDYRLIRTSSQKLLYSSTVFFLLQSALRVRHAAVCR